MGTQLLTPREVAARLRVSRRTVERLMARFEMPVIEIGRARRVRESDLEAFIKTHERPPLASPARRRAETPRP